MTDRRELARHVGLPAVLVPLVIALALCAFAWPAARLQPRNLPVGVVGTTPVENALAHGGAFDVHHYADEDDARAALRDREIYGAFETTSNGLTVLIASAASPTVAQQLTALGEGAAPGRQATIVDVVPLSAEDPHGAVLSSAVLPLVFGGEIIAVVVALLLGVRPSSRQLGALVVTSVTTAALAYVVAQGWLGALPHDHLATFGALALLLLSIASTTAGLLALLGVRGIGVAAATMIFLGNPFSGATSAPDLLPAPANWLGRLLPPGAGTQLVRSTAYFDGHGALTPTLVLLGWTIAGAAALVVGHRRLEHGDHEQSAKHAVPEPVG